MGRSRNGIFCNRIRHLMVSLLLLLVSSSIRHAGFFTAEGRAISKPIEPAKREGKDDEEETGMMAMKKLQMGSSPPRCDRRCESCGRCEAIQVPVTARARDASRITGYHHLSAQAALRTSYSRGDDVTNYKPMSWKCKCGDLIFNP